MLSWLKSLFSRKRTAADSEDTDDDDRVHNVCPGCALEHALVETGKLVCPRCFAHYHVDADGTVSMPGQEESSPDDLSPPKSFDEHWEQILTKTQTSEWPLHVVTAGAFSHYGAEAAGTLQKHLDDNDLAVVVAAGLALAQLNDQADSIVPRIVELLDDPNGIVRIHMRWVLRGLLPECVPVLTELYESKPDRRSVIADALAFFGPRAETASETLEKYADQNEEAGAALRQIRGPWNANPDQPLPYINECISLDDGAPMGDEALGMALWIESLQRAVERCRCDGWNALDRSQWNPQEEQELTFGWAPDQVAIARPSLTLCSYFGADELPEATIEASDGEKFTNMELLRELMEVYNDISPQNGRIFEGLMPQEDGRFYISTGS